MLGGRSIITTPAGGLQLRHAAQCEEVLTDDGSFEEVSISPSVPLSQPVIKATLGLVRPGPRTITWDVYCSPEQEFMCTYGVTRYYAALKKGEVLAPSGRVCGWDQRGWAHGFAFGTKGPQPNEIGLGGHQQFRQRLEPFLDPEKPQTPLKCFLKPLCKWDELPDDRETTLYWSSFFKGWADSTGKDKRLISSNHEAVLLFKERCYIAGFVPTGEITRDTPLFFKHKEIISVRYRLWYSDLRDIKGFKVLEVQEVKEPLLAIKAKEGRPESIVLYPGILAKVDNDGNS